MARDIRPNLEKLWSPNPNQLTIEGLTWKKNINYTKGSKTKKNQLKEWESKSKYKINFIFYWRMRLKRKNNLIKRKKIIKRMKIKIEINKK
jgi:hypothetical protein